MPCSNCDIGGHSVDVCPELREERHGVASDYDADGEWIGEDDD